MRVALTGASGVLGRTIRSTFPDYDWIGFEGDIRNQAQVIAWVRSLDKIDAILHFAAIVARTEVERDPTAANQVNVGGGEALLAAVSQISERERPWTFVASTAHVYKSSNAPLSESDAVEPISTYGRTKLAAEKVCRRFSEAHGLDICIGRIFSFTSPYQNRHFFIPAMFQKIAEAPENARLDIPGLLGVRDFLSATLVSRAIGVLAKMKPTGLINIGSGRGTRLLDVCLEIRDLLHRDDVEIVPSSSERSSLVADVSRLRSLGAEQSISITDLLKQNIYAPR